MAARKTTTKRAKKKAGVGTLAIGGSTSIGGIRMKKKSCSKTKVAAKKAAKAIRAKGYTARVIGTCVFQGRKRKRTK